MYSYDLEDRLVTFASDIILFVNSLPQNIAGKNLTNQVTRSSTSAALNFGEFQGGESKKDKIHKLGIVLKELIETKIALKIIIKINYGDSKLAEKLLNESKQLASIIASIIIKKKKL